jgi:hypothetical protein
VLEDAHAMIGELWKVLAKGGKLSLTSLVMGRSIGDKYLRFLHRSGGVSSPRDTSQVLTIFSEMSIPTDHYRHGNMLFIHSKRSQ